MRNNKFQELADKWRRWSDGADPTRAYTLLDCADEIEETIAQEEQAQEAAELTKKTNREWVKEMFKQLHCDSCDTAFSIDVKTDYCPCCAGVIANE